MTTYDFECAAKQAVANYQNGIKDRDVVASDFHVVWMCHLLGNKKCILCEMGSNHIYEVTYNCEKNELYVDDYAKVFNRKITGEHIDELLGKKNFDESAYGAF